MFGFFNELKNVVGLDVKEIAKSYKVAFVDGGGVMVSNFQRILNLQGNRL